MGRKFGDEVEQVLSVLGHDVPGIPSFHRWLGMKRNGKKEGGREGGKEGKWTMG